MKLIKYFLTAKNILQNYILFNFNFKKFFFWLFLFLWIFFLLSQDSFAGGGWYLPNWWANQIDSQLKLTHKTWDWVEQINSYLTLTFVPLVKFIMVWIAILFLILGLFSIIFATWEESETEAKTFWWKFWFAILWFILISFAERIANAVNPLISWNIQNFWNIWAFEWMATILVNFASVLIWWFAVAVIVISWINILKSQWEWIEDEFKKILSAWLWLIVTLLSRKFIYEIFFTWYWMKWVNENANISASQEVMWTVSYFMQFIAIWWVALIIIAWIYYMTSSWEDNDNTKLAQSIIKNVSIWLVILMSSYSLVTIFLPN